ncbi:MAG: hypothetical protein NTX12_04310 [Actinobacteria bacterium]|nr:hypothetical protein [Actinomycetota bacterium]
MKYVREATDREAINREALNWESFNQGDLRYETPAPASSEYRRPEQITLRPSVRRNWSHFATVAFAIYVTVASLAPLLLSTVLGISLFDAHSDLVRGAIAKGDLMVSHTISADRLVAGDVVILRDANSWKLEVRQVVDVTTLRGSSTISTTSGTNSALTEVFTLSNDSSVRFITSHIPFLGFVSIFLNSLAIKIAVTAGIVFINIYAYFRRRHPVRDGQRMVLASR